MPAAPPDAKEVNECSPALPLGRTRRVVANVVADEATGRTNGLVNMLTHNWAHKLMGEPYRLAIRGIAARPTRSGSMTDP